MALMRRLYITILAVTRIMAQMGLLSTAHSAVAANVRGISFHSGTLQEST